ncbi:hypothetical protein [Methylobacterium guangdongense]
MDRTIKDATVERYHDVGHPQLHAHSADIVRTYHTARRLGVLR